MASPAGYANTKPQAQSADRFNPAAAGAAGRNAPAPDPAAAQISAEQAAREGTAAILRLGLKGVPARPDPVTLGGLTAAFVMLFGAMLFSGSVRAFYDVPAALVVIGGTLAVTITSFSLQDLLGLRRVVARALLTNARDPSAFGKQLLQLAEAARRGGPMSLTAALKGLKAERFLHRCLSPVADGLPADEIERLLRGEIEADALRNARGAAILRRAADVAPAMGLIGTLIGLVQMLGTLDNPSTIGPNMAIALLTTFYGAVLANMVFAPLASKLERNADDEALLQTITLMSALSIARQENPRRLEMLMNTVLPPAAQLRYFD